MSAGDPADGGAPRLARAGGHTLAYRRSEPRGAGASRAGVVFLGGFKSDMTGDKALTLERHCREHGRAFVRFDYLGHGASSGRFEDGTIGRWAEDALAVLDRLTEGSQVLVGSSMGGWIMLLAALARPRRVAGLVGIASAPDFTENLIWRRLDETARARLTEEGVLYRPSAYDDDPYPITRRLLEEGRRHLLLEAGENGGADRDGDANGNEVVNGDGPPVPIRCPLRLLHGMRDADVPWRTSLALSERVASDDVRLTLIKDGEHRLSRPQDLELLLAQVAELG